MARTALGVLLALAALYTLVVVVNATADALDKGGSAVLWTSIVFLLGVGAGLLFGARRFLRRRA